MSNSNQCGDEKITYVTLYRSKSKKFCSKSCHNKYRWKQENYRDEMKKVLTQGKKFDTKPELQLENMLCLYNVPYIKQQRFDRFIYDFYLPIHKIVIEVDGEYWHSSVEAKERDKLKDINILNRTSRVSIIDEEWKIKEYEIPMKILRFSDKEIFNSSCDVINKIFKTIGGVI